MGPRIYRKNFKKTYEKKSQEEKQSLSQEEKLKAQEYAQAYAQAYKDVMEIIHGLTAQTDGLARMVSGPQRKMSNRHELEKENAEQAPSNQKSFVGVSSSLRNNSFGVPSLPDMSKQVAGGAKKKTEFKDIIVPVSPIETLEPEKKFYNEVSVPKIKGILFWSRPRLPQVVKNYTLRKGDMVRTLQSKNAKNGYAERKEGSWGTISDERFPYTGKDEFPEDVKEIRVDWEGEGEG